MNKDVNSCHNGGMNPGHITSTVTQLTPPEQVGKLLWSYQYCPVYFQLFGFISDATLAFLCKNVVISHSGIMIALQSFAESRKFSVGSRVKCCQRQYKETHGEETKACSGNSVEFG